jgi:oligopeptide/dipeptide ABC transporter ATP-binding protein
MTAATTQANARPHSPHPPADPSLLLQAQGITKSFWGRGSFMRARSENRAVDNVTISLVPGEVLGLVGESGCGKSTLAKILLGLEQADAGSLAVDGTPMFGPDVQALPAARRGIQMIFQDPYGSLNPRMTVRDLVGEGLRIRGGLSRAEITAEVRRHLALVGLGEDSLAKYAHQFSGGQRQRLCIARAIIVNPKVLIADEAASALDVSVQMQILNLLLDLRDRIGLGIIFISHDMSVIEYLCDRVAVMYRGRIVEEGVASAVLDRPRHPYTGHLIAARPRVGRRRAAAIAADEDPAELAGLATNLAMRCVYAERCERVLDRCRAERPVLTPDGTTSLACFNPFDDR